MIRCSRIPGIRAIGVAALLVSALVLAEGIAVSEATLAEVELTYGHRARAKIERWRVLMKDQTGSDQAKLRRVNDFFNDQLFIDDILHWGKKDYWATPLEFLATGAGDCEDFALAKYFTLNQMGVPESKLRLTYVKAVQLNQAHMVLTYFATASADPLVLDNLDAEIRPATKRKDLVPVYSFNGDGLWLAKQRGSGKRVGGASRLSLWTELNQRMRKMDVPERSRLRSRD